jgi:hypothetical protein
MTAGNGISHPQYPGSLRPQETTSRILNIPSAYGYANIKKISVNV